ncbi:MAG TPA: efflux RND transporter periplasmic adaptor subunit [Vicinamibacterales bacterium]|nr:efflux RND transporter periplasmic adaptor subunit [Vicinamibacterales bacterium]HOQ59510.1 efflux RND transporter periplasmic adaptor subunit [Vicinamibacterales bacterium]HPK72540.1 efflux RND transporter periplasmic adaptor subunit [Vicinamibacterales bacterium]HPW21498.1 efflux RND transporter periplasmic adaptor subunit [Vicinamibacterales bacterium]
MKRRTLGLLAGTGLVLVATAAALERGGGVLVDTAPVARKADFRSTVTSSGQIVAQRYADIGSSVMGRLVQLRVREGDAVEAGQVVARIDAVQAAASASAANARVKASEAEVRGAADTLRAAEADLDAARARAQEAQLTLRRTRDLRADGLVPAAELDRATAAAETADAQLRGAEAALRRLQQAREATERRLAEARAEAARAADVLAKTDIVSPMAGVVTRLPVQEGEMVVMGIQGQLGTTLMTISDLSAVNAEVKVAEADVVRLALNQSAVVTLEAVPGERFAGRVVEIGASALPVAGSGAAAREFRVKVRLETADRRLRPGLTCDAEILTAERQHALVVPLQAVVIRPGRDGRDEAGLFVAAGRSVRFQPVTAGIIGGLDIEVSGVEDGAVVVTGPYQALRDLQDGQAVRVRSRQ